MEIDIRADVKAATKNLTAIERKVIKRATNRALNKTAVNVRTKIVRHISQVTGLKVGEVKAGTTLTKSTFGTLRADVRGHGRAVNLIRFVSAGKRAVGAFNKQLGVRANAWRSSKVYTGSFIIRGKGHGKLIVVARTSQQKQPLKGLAGPSIRVEMNRRESWAIMVKTAQERFLINFNNALAFYLSRI